ncbi:MFS transporter [Polynucleobacter sp. SHI8]|uniref:Bug family tripartite tricarboxylate transporter substrate binding protein n=1 Tax=unclassified Polynucleobacter TaxID=2640945 RepID=UPI00249173C1|nr:MULTISPECIES: tripartite tricarboxylate transporter substrate binding protein [unclassified Polynucleobacter]BDW10366.1 MFS transporter [Polynucleobacter sp. SHI2]BDW12812.1 MFS transporter [Polynucleobacter sp. SHI8]
MLKIFGLLFFGLISQLALSQSYPNKTVKMVVPFETGTPDSIARILAPQLTSLAGQSFYVENHPGANGMIGADLVAKAKPDGYTLLVTSTSITVNPSYYKKLNYDLKKDLIPVTNLGNVEALLIVINAKSPIKNINEFLTYAKNPENKVSYGSPGNGNHLHISSALFNQRMGLNMVHIPYKGAGPATTALIGEQIQVLITTPSSVLPFIKDGRLKAIGFTGLKRSTLFPEVPTVAEQGFPNFEIDGGWFGLFTTAGTPKETVLKIQQLVRQAYDKKSVADSIIQIGLDPVADSPEQFKTFTDAEVLKYANRLKSLNIQAE